MITEARNELLRVTVHIRMAIAENKLCHLGNQVKFPEYNKTEKNVKKDETWLIDLGRPLPVKESTVRREGN